MLWAVRRFSRENKDLQSRVLASQLREASVSIWASLSSALGEIWIGLVRRFERDVVATSDGLRIERNSSRAGSLKETLKSSERVKNRTGRGATTIGVS